MEDQKPKRKYQRRKAKVEPLAVYAVMVTVARGRKVETIYAESTRVENGCLVVISMDGPQPLVEKTRYIPLGDAEITVCKRPTPTWGENAYLRMVQPFDDRRQALGQPAGVPISQWPGGDLTRPSGPQIIAGPLGMIQGQQRPQTREVRDIVERNAEGVPVVSAGFLDGSPT